jgi:hypothetical protein
MVNQTALNLQLKPTNNLTLNQTLAANERCPAYSANHHDGQFVWAKQIQGFLLSAYYYGYILTQVKGLFKQN